MKKNYTSLLLAFLLLLMVSSSLFAQFDVNISTNATANVSTATVGTVKTYTATATGANVQIATIFADFINGISEVKIETGTSGGSQNGNITLANPINYNGIGLGKTLTLNARNAIAINSSITDGTVGGDLLNLNMTASGLANALTALNIAAALETNGGNINLTGTNNSDVGSGDNGAILVNANMNTAGGNISLIGTALNTTAGFGTRVGTTNQPIINTSGGKFTMIGECNGFSTAAAFQGSLTTNGGDINVRGEAKAKSGNPNGNSTIIAVNISVFNANVFSSGSGNITINGETNANFGSRAVILAINSVGNPISTTSGNFTVTGRNKSALPPPPLSDTNAAILLFGRIVSNTGKIVINTEVNNGQGLDIREPISTNGDIEINANTANPNFSTGQVFSGITGTISSGNGKIIIKASGNSFNMSLGGSLTSNNGDISIEHLGGVGLGTNGGIFIYQPIQSANGNITIKGTNNNATTNARGVYTSTNGTITTTGTGKISITGSNTSDVPAVEINQPITSGGSDITISGTNTGTGVGVLINSTVSSTGTVGNGRVEESEAVNGELTITGANNANAPSVQINAPIQTNNNNIFITGTNKGTGANARGIFITNTVNASGAGSLNLIGETGTDVGEAIGATVNIASNKDINIKTDKGGFNAPNIQSNGGVITLTIATNANLNVNNNIFTTAGAAINILYGNNGLSTGALVGGNSFIGGSISNGANTINAGISRNIILGTISIRRNGTPLTPNVPQTVNAQAGNGQIVLTWSEDMSAVRYEIYVYSANQAQRLVGTTDKNTFTVIGLENTVNYFFRIVAYGVDGSNSDFSTPVSARPSVVLGVEEETASTLFQVYPNPSNGSFTLKANELKGRNATISILDMSGRTVYSQALQANGSVETELNLNLSSGVYLLSISTEKDNLKRKLVVQK